MPLRRPKIELLRQHASVGACKPVVPGHKCSHLPRIWAVIGADCKLLTVPVLNAPPLPSQHPTNTPDAWQHCKG